MDREQVLNTSGHFADIVPPTYLFPLFRCGWPGPAAMGDDYSPMSGRRRESTRPCSMWSQSARILWAGGLLGVLMSVVYYRALGPPQVWVETVGRSGGGGSWWLGGGKAGNVNLGGSMPRHTARNLGSVEGGWKADA